MGVESVDAVSGCLGETGMRCATIDAASPVSASAPSRRILRRTYTYKILTLMILGAILQCSLAFSSTRLQAQQGRDGRALRRDIAALSLKMQSSADDRQQQHTWSYLNDGERTPKFDRKPILRTVAQDQAVLAFSADEPSSATVELGLTSAFELGTRTLADQVLDHEVLVDGLLPGTEYFLRVGLTDALGNGPTYAPEFVLKTALAPDEIPPQILTGPFSPPATQSEAVVEWTTDEPATRAVRYWIQGQPETAAFVDVTNCDFVVAYYN